MTVCLTLAIFLGTSAAQPIVPEDSVCPLDPTTVQQQFKEGETTIGNKSPKKLGKREISESSAEHGTHYCFVSGTINMHGMYGKKNCSSSLPLFIAVLIVVFLGHNLISAK